MSRCIDADALEKEGWSLHRTIRVDKNTEEYQTKPLRQVPTIEPERKKGTWIEYDNSHCECPFCHEEWSYFDNEVEYFNYCPNCGAEMTEGEE